ncbi:MAG TPA: DUF4439 domain-containing protein [Acidothermaceae bacterium]|jgi:hypothetical protein|nr:DUF4439 domain-containing protein [Acidothermaceae bacterium]
MTTLSDALLAAAAAENAAVYGYSLAGARLATPQDKATARAAYDVHRAQVEALTEQLASLGVGASPPPASPVYVLPSPVTDATSARATLAAIEESTAATYADVVAAAPPGSSALLRDAALWLQSAAVREAQWRTTSVPFPGLVGRLPS